MQHNTDKSAEMAARDNGLIKVVDAAYTMLASDKVLYVAPTAARAITLPNPTEWIGDVKAIYAIADGSAAPASYNVTISAPSHVRGTFTPVVLDAGDEWTIVMSLGEAIVEVAKNHA